MPIPSTRPAVRAETPAPTARAATAPACVGQDPDLFNPVSGDETAEARRRRVAIATGICSRCPIRPTCLNDAIDRADSGVWGGVLLRHGVTDRPQAVEAPVPPVPQPKAEMDDWLLIIEGRDYRSFFGPAGRAVIAELVDALCPGLPVAPCGTRAAEARHRRYGEPIDAACRKAERERCRLKGQRRRANRLAMAA